MTTGGGQGLAVRLLGPVQAWRGEEELALGAPMRRAVFGLLAMRANRVVSRDELVDGVWGEDPPASSVNALHGHVATLRGLLEPGRPHRAPGQVLLASGPGYLLRLAPGQLDVEVYGRHLDAARAARAAGDLAVSVACFEAASLMWQAVPLSGIPGPWAEIERVRLGEQRLTAVEECLDSMLAAGRHAEAAAQLAGLVREYPLRERLHGQLMLALYRCGRQAEALAAFTAARGVLVGELGIEPGPALRRVQDRILAADGALDLPAEGAAALTSGPPLARRGEDRPGPAQLPGDVDAFTGRADELAALDRLAASAAGPVNPADPPGAGPSAVAISVLSGSAGVGKTALAVHWSRRAARAFPDGQLYVDLRGYDADQPVDPADALAGFLRALGMPGQDIPAEAEQRAAAYRSLLDGRRMLVVLDNAAAVEQVRPLLPGGASCAVLVTSRDSLAALVARHGAQRLDLDALPLSDAVALLRALIGRRAGAEPAAAATLAGQCARLPLALRVAAELAAASPAITLAGLTAELADERRRLDLLDAGGDARTAVRAVFSWSYRHLPAAAARVFRLVGLHPGADLDARAAAALTASSLDQAQDLLYLLARGHLVESAGPGRYGMHDLLRAYARQLAAAEDSEDARRAALTGLFDYYLGVAASAMDTLVPAERQDRPHVAAAGAAPALTDTASARGWLDAERATLVAIAAHAATRGWPGHATRLAGTVYRYLETGGHYVEAVTMHSHARSAAARSGDHSGEATALTNLGIVSWRLGRYAQAAGHYQRALTVSRRIGDRTGEAFALGNLGAVFERQGRYQQATSCQRQALALFRRTGHRSGEARSLGNLGSVAARQGGYAQAIGYYQRALALFRASGDRIGEASALPDLGVAYQRQGEHERAAGCYQRALALFRETGDRTGEAEALNGAGETQLSAGRPHEARAQHAAALTLSSQTGDRYEQARAHAGLAATHRATGDAGLGHYHRHRAVDLYAVLGAPEPSAPDYSPDYSAQDYSAPDHNAEDQLADQGVA